MLDSGILSKDVELENILQILPHGKEALIKGLRINGLAADDLAIGYACFPDKSKYFRGHFPKSPCLPFHIVQEIAHQVMQVAILSALSQEQRSELRPLCWKWDELRLADQILPNEVFKMVAQIIDPRPLLVSPKGIKVIKGLCLGSKVVEEKTIFEGTVYFSLVPKDKIKKG